MSRCRHEPRVHRLLERASAAFLEAEAATKAAEEEEDSVDDEDEDEDEDDNGNDENRDDALQALHQSTSKQCRRPHSKRVHSCP